MKDMYVYIILINILCMFSWHANKLETECFIAIKLKIVYIHKVYERDFSLTISKTSGFSVI